MRGFAGLPFVYLSFKVIVLNNTVHSRKVNLITYKNVLMLLKDEKQECVVSFTVCKDRSDCEYAYYRVVSTAMGL